MAMTMTDKEAAQRDRSAWPSVIRQEFKREARKPNGCVGTRLLSQTDKVRVWSIHLNPGERVGFHRHVLDYFWTAMTTCRGRQHLMDGTTVDYTYQAGETRHESYGPGEFKVHDLENIGGTAMVFITVEFLASANTPLTIPDAVAAASPARRPAEALSLPLGELL